VGARHALFPRSTDIGRPMHPSSAIGCQFPDAAPACEGRFACVSGSAAEPADGVATTGFSGETSWPGSPTPAGARFPDPLDGAAAGSGFAFLLFSGVGIVAEHGPRSLAPEGRVLSLTPHVAFHFPRRTIPFPEPPALSDLIGFSHGHRLARRLPPGDLNP
jgi:hypothetical protein